MYVEGDIVERNSTTKNSDGGGCVWRPRRVVESRVRRSTRGRCGGSGGDCRDGGGLARAVRRGDGGASDGGDESVTMATT